MTAKRLPKQAPLRRKEAATAPEETRDLLDKLHVSETRYRRLFETAQDGILLLDPETGQITDVNPFLLDLLGYPYKEIVGKKLWEIGPFRDRAEARHAFAKLQTDHYARYENLPLEASDGRRVQVEFVSNLYAVGDIEVIQCNIRDITQGRSAEDVARGKDLSKELALTAGELGVWRLDLATGKTWRSPRHDQIFGYPALLPEWTYEIFLSHVLAEDCDAVAESFGKALATKTDWDFTCRIRRKDGEVRWIWAKGEPELNERHAAVALIGLIQDITERKQAEASLADSELKYRQVVDNASQAIFVVQGARIVFPNPMVSTMIGYSREEVMARPFTEFIHPDDRDMVVERHTSRMKREDVPPVYGFRIVRKDGAVRWVELNAVLIDWQGEPATLDFLSDITERKLAREEKEILARFPAENPNPVLRVAQDGEILYANPPSEPLLRLWKAAKGGYVPAEWRERVAAVCVLGPGGGETIEVKCDGKTYSIVIAVASAGYINLYGHNVTELKRAEAERERVLERQLVLNRITLALGATTDLPSILRRLHREVQALLDVDGFFVFRYHKDTGLITALFVVDEGVERDVATLPPIPLAPEGKGMQSQVLRTGQPLNVANWIERERTMQTVYHIASDGELTAPPPEDEREKCTKSALLVPMMLQGEPVGVLQVQSNRLNAYSDQDVDLLAGLANVAAVSIRNALLVEEVRLGLEGTIEALAGTTEMRDPYTAGHQRRVSQLVCAIAENMGLADKTVEGLRVSGLLHDIGKVAVPAEILSKPSALTPVEFSLVREHVKIGFGVLKGIAFPWPVAEIVLQHHERLDGSGYPQALKGNAIVLGARILAVADVVEAMASHRPYRTALGIDAALEEIREQQGRLYDSDVVDACIQLFASGFEFA